MLGVLGPNGAGKTTAVRDPRDPAAARRAAAPASCGLDVVKRRRRRPPDHRADRAVRLRRRGPDRPREPRPHRPAAGPVAATTPRRGPAELLEQFGLTEAGDRAREDVLRRHAPPPRPRRQPGRPARRSSSSTSRPPVSTRASARTSGRWSASSSTTASTVLLTTQYLEEADALADEISVIDKGKVIAHGTAERAEAPHRRADARGPSRRPGAAAPRSRRCSPRSPARTAESPSRGAAQRPRRRRHRHDHARRPARLDAASPSPSSRCGCPASTRSSSHSPATEPPPTTRRSRHEHRPSTATLMPPRARTTTSSRPFPLLRHSLTLAKRSVLKIRRTPEQLVDVTLQPIIFVLLFVYLFGGAIAGNDARLPAVRAAGDHGADASRSRRVSHRREPQHRHQQGRLRPVPQPADRPVGAAGRRGARRRRPLRDLGRRAARLRLRPRLPDRDQPRCRRCSPACWSSGSRCACAGSRSSSAWCCARRARCRASASCVMFPLTFGSNLFVPTDTLPGWLQAWVSINPVTYLVETTRSLMLGGPVLVPLTKTVICAPGAARGLRAAGRAGLPAQDLTRRTSTRAAARAPRRA